ncbi:MAG: phosphoribosylformylglycinamidine synthase [Cytophagaceae bacterium]|nr:phosphoribosylformylglycinamidine synthase [Cytophagaceae bacterium]
MDAALKTMIANMPEKTGKSLETWKQILQEKAFDKHMQAVNYLKKEHGVTHGFANTIVSLSKEDTSSTEDLIASQYAGKEQLFPIYNALIAYAKSLGDDVVISPKKTTVSVVRKKQFILVKPATKTRIDLGLKLKDIPVGTRLEGSGPFGSMCTHRVRITSPSDLDQELKDWIALAYTKAD